MLIFVSWKNLVCRPLTSPKRMLNRSGLLKIRTDERVRAEIFNTFLNVGYLLYKIGNLRRKVDFSWTINILMKQWDRTNVCKLRRFGDLEKTYYCTFSSQTLAAKVWTCQSLNATQLPVRTLARSNFGTIAKLPKFECAKVWNAFICIMKF